MDDINIPHINAGYCLAMGVIYTIILICIDYRRHGMMKRKRLYKYYFLLWIALYSAAMTISHYISRGGIEWENLFRWY